jgi:glycosyltransferase involved in cell wall biosynthesis
VDISWESTNKDYSADVLIAALNEEKGIGLTLAEMQRYVRFRNLIVIDGHSGDRTVEVAKDLGAQVLLQNGTGKGDALAEGIKYIGNDIDYVVVTDADYTYPAEYVPEMIKILENNPNIGMVCGNRFNEQAEEKALHNLFYFGNVLLALSHNLINGVGLEDPLTGLRVVRAEILRNWQVKSKGFDVEVELNSQVKRVGFEIVEMPIQYRNRIGEKKLKAKHGAEILKRILLESIY